MDDDELKKEIVKATVGAGAELAKDVYSDGFKRSMQAVGQILYGVIVPFETLAKAWSGMWERFQAEIAEKMKDVPPENIQEAPRYLSYQLLQAYPFTEDEPELRDLFQQLLASSMNTDTVDECHPAFVEMLKQMTADEAKLMRAFERHHAFAVLEVNSAERDAPDTPPRPSLPATLYVIPSRNAPRRTIAHLFDLRMMEVVSLSPHAVHRCLDNLERLGLIYLDLTRHIADGDPYAPIFESKAYKDLQVEHQGGPRVLVEPRRGYACLTALGSSFVAACIGRVANAPAEAD